MPVDEKDELIINNRVNDAASSSDTLITNKDSPLVSNASILLIKLTGPPNTFSTSIANF